MKKIRLNDIEKVKAPFTVPDGYFEKLERQIQSAVSARPGPESRAMKVRWALVPAAAAILLTVAWLIMPSSENTSGVSEMIAQIPEEEILEYLAYSDISMQEIAAISPEGILDDLGALDHLQLDENSLDDLLEMYESEEIDMDEI